MTPNNPVILILNVLMISISLGLFLITLWNNTKASVTRFFALFLIAVVMWNIGIIGLQLENIIISSSDLIFRVSATLTQLGYSLSTVGLYSLVVTSSANETRIFRVIVVLSSLIACVYNVFLLFIPDHNIIIERADNSSTFFFLTLGLSTLYIVWRYRNKFSSFLFVIGVTLFVVSQSTVFFNQTIGVSNLAAIFNAIGTFLISIALIQRDIIMPLSTRSEQLETMHEVTVAITSQIASDTILGEINEQAIRWLEADSSLIFLIEQSQTIVVSGVGIPYPIIGREFDIQTGLSGKTISTRRTIYIENLQNDWNAPFEFPDIQDSIGSVICTPLKSGDDVIGAIMVISAAQGQIFTANDVRSLELLANQAAVVLAQDRSFATQRELASQLQNAHDQLQAVLTSTENPVIAVNRHNRLVFANLASEKLFQLVAKDNGRAITELIPAEFLPNYREVLRSVRAGKSYNYELEFENRSYFCTIAPLGHQRIEGWVAVMNDVSQLKELDRIKSEMVRMTSHDLKNPLQAAIANLDLLRDDVEDLDNEEVEIFVNNIEKNLIKMHRIISGILDLERARLSNSLLETCQIKPILENILDDLSDMINEKSLVVTMNIAPDLPDFLGDSKQFERALSNLIENAIKFSQINGSIEISVVQRKFFLRIIVKDEGIGIPDALHLKIFDRFYRGMQPGAEHVSGSGLGLSLVKAVVEGHRGRVWVESQSGEGASFFIEIPVNKEALELN